MYHSVNIESTTRANDRYNTYDTFSAHLIPEKRPLIKPPEVKKNYVDIPGAHGSLDYTEALNGILYTNRTGSWEFYVDNGYQDTEGTWNIMYSELMNSIHGKYFDYIWLEDDAREFDGLPSYYYKGRIFVNEWRSDPQFSKIVLDYDLEPYKYPSPKEGDNVDDWLWDSLFGDATVNPIRYGTFTVNGNKHRTIVGQPGGTVVVFSSQAMNVKLPDDTVISVPASTSTSFTLSGKGTDRVIFTGHGQVTLTYDEGPEL